MAKWKNSPELDNYLKMLEKLTDTREYIGEAVYKGAGVVADAVRAQIQTLPVAQKFADDGKKIATITSVQKKGLLDGFGISPMREENGYVHVKLGFAGYNGQKTTQYPNGVPNSVVARSIISGTYFRQKNDFVGKAVRANKAKAQREMEEAFEEALKTLLW